MTEPEFDAEFEDEIVARCLADDSYLRSAAPLLDGHHFSSPYVAWVWGVVKETWVSYVEKATPKLLTHRARTDFPDGDARRPYLEAVVRLAKLEPASPKAALGELRRFARFVRYQDEMHEAAKALADGDLDEVHSHLALALRGAPGESGYEVCRFIEEFETRQAERRYKAEHPEEARYVPTGIRGLDSVIRGVQPEELAFVMATTNMGKSIFLVNVTYWAAMKGHPVVLVVTEMGLSQTAQRMDSRFTGMLYDAFKEWSFTGAELRKMTKRVERWFDDLKDKLRIVSVPVGSKFSLVQEACLDMGSEMGGLDLVVCDSVDHLKPDVMHRETRLNFAQTYWDFKAFLQEQKCGGWSSTQAGKEWAGGKTVRAEAASESYDKSRIADLIITLNEPSKRDRATVVDDDDSEETDEPPKPAPLVEGFIAKARDSESRRKFGIEADLARMLMKGTLDDD